MLLRFFCFKRTYICLLCCSTELIRRMRRYSIANYDCLLVKNIKDTRYDKDGLATHDL